MAVAFEALSPISIGCLLMLVTVAAAWDLASFRIPNWISVVITSLFLVFSVIQGMPFLAVLAHIGTGGVVFIVGAILFFLKMFGGGDVKLLAASSVWAGPDHAVDLILIMMVAGGVFAMVLLVARALPEKIKSLHPVVAGCLSGQKRMPYAVAIAAAVWILFLAMPAVSGNLYISEGFAASVGYWG